MMNVQKKKIYNEQKAEDDEKEEGKNEIKFIDITSNRIKFEFLLCWVF